MISTPRLPQRNRFTAILSMEESAAPPLRPAAHWQPARPLRFSGATREPEAIGLALFLGCAHTWEWTQALRSRTCTHSEPRQREVSITGRLGCHTWETYFRLFQFLRCSRQAANNVATSSPGLIWTPRVTRIWKARFSKRFLLNNTIINKYVKACVCVCGP